MTVAVPDKYQTIRYTEGTNTDRFGEHPIIVASEDKGYIYLQVLKIGMVT